MIDDAELDAGSPKQANASKGSVDPKVAARRERIELEKLKLEVKELRAWRAKWVSTLLISFLGPIGAALAFIAGLYVSHETDRKATADARFEQAVQLASNADSSLRMAGMTSLSTFTRKSPTDSGIFNWVAKKLDYSGETDAEKDRADQGVVLVIARLSVETNPSLLLLMKDAVLPNKAKALPLLLAANRQAADQFARASGEYSGLAILHILKQTYADQESEAVKEPRKQAQQVLVDGILRTGSPFGTPGTFNATFQPGPFLDSAEFKRIFEQAERKALFSNEPESLRSRILPPDSRETDNALKVAQEAYAYLIRTSDLLVEFAKTYGDWVGKTDLRGNAIVRGDPKEGKFDQLRSKGAYVQMKPSS